MISLVKDTINDSDIEKLIVWLKEGHRLTKGPETLKFEEKWSQYLGVKYSVFLNSGSSANLAMTYSLIESKRLKNNKIIVPSVSWVTTVSPVIQLGLTPILCDCDKDDLGLDVEHLELLFKEHNPSAVILVHVLGVPNKMDEIMSLCDKYNVILLEDSCESIGSKYNKQLTGTFGLMSSFSFYFGHHMSTIEGGMVSTNDFEMYQMLLSIRSHGWNRDLTEDNKKMLNEKYDLNEFRALYTFFHPGFNLRSTDLQAFIGNIQLDKIDDIVKKRINNFNLYNDFLNDDFWKVKPSDNTVVSNFAYPIIVKNVVELSGILFENGVENRPLICGSINEQPFWYEKYGKTYLPNSKVVHYNGMYLPNNPDMSLNEIRKITDIVNFYGEKL